MAIIRRFSTLLIASTLLLGCNAGTEIAKTVSSENTSPLPTVSPSVSIFPSPSESITTALPIQTPVTSSTPIPSPTCSSPWNFTSKDLEWKIPEDRYVFIEDVIDWYSNRDGFVYIDFPEYDFYKDVGFLQGALNTNVDKDLKIIVGGCTTGSGSIRGISSGLTGISKLDSNSSKIRIFKVDSDGTAYMQYNCKPFVLKPGQEWKIIEYEYLDPMFYTAIGSKTSSSPKPDIYTHTITNYGVLKKSKLRIYPGENKYFEQNIKNYPEIKPDFPPSLTPQKEISLIPKGEKIAFYSNREAIPAIYVIQPDWSNTTKLAVGYSLFSSAPSWSPDGTKLAFARDDEIYVLNSEGNLQKLFTRKGDAKYINPNWSPDSKSIIFGEVTKFWWRELKKCDLYTINTNGSDFKKISSPLNLSGDFGINPVWSPDGNKIFFQSDDRDEIWSMNSDGSNQIKLTDDLCFTPVCSPDGKKIALATYRDRNYEIYTMNTDGTEMVNLTKNPANDAGPSYSPDSKKIAFFSNRDGNWEIYVMNADGSDQKRITNNPASDMYPAWSR